MPTYTPNFNLAKPLVNDPTDEDLWGGELNGNMDIIDTALAAAVASGTVTMWPVASAPAGYLLCDGTAYSRTTYPALFTILGTLYGVGDGSTTFNIPDYRGYFLRGLDNGRGIDTGRTMGTIQADALGTHTHTITDDGHTHDVTASKQTGTSLGGPNNNTGTNFTFATTSSTTGIIINATGDVETRPKNISINFVIKT